MSMVLISSLPTHIKDLVSLNFGEGIVKNLSYRENKGYSQWLAIGICTHMLMVMRVLFRFIWLLVCIYYYLKGGLVSITNPPFY